MATDANTLIERAAGLRAILERHADKTDSLRRLATAVRPPEDRLDALRAAGVEVALAGTNQEGRVDLASALDTLGRMEINEVLVESGPKLAGALLQAQRVDELVLYVAPSLLGDEARALANLPGLAALDQRIRLRYTDSRMVGADLRITAVPDLPGASRG